MTIVDRVRAFATRAHAGQKENNPVSNDIEDALKQSSLDALISAVWQVLDDFGRDGKSVCAATKAQLRVAFEPFWTESEWGEMRYCVASSPHKVDRDITISLCDKIMTNNPGL